MLPRVALHPPLTRHLLPTGGEKDLSAFNVFLRVVGELAPQVARLLRRILAAVLLAAGTLVSEGFGAANHVDFLDFLFSGSLVVAHDLLLSKEDTGPRACADEREIIFAASDECGEYGTAARHRQRDTAAAGKSSLSARRV